MVVDRSFRLAIPPFEKALQLDPRYATGHQWFGELLTGVGRCEECAAHMDRAEETVEYCSAPDCTGIRGAILGRKGNREGAMALLQAPTVISSVNLKPVVEVRTHVGLGDIDRAFERLRAAMPEGNSYLIWSTVGRSMIHFAMIGGSRSCSAILGWTGSIDRNAQRLFRSAGRGQAHFSPDAAEPRPDQPAESDACISAIDSRRAVCNFLNS